MLRVFVTHSDEIAIQNIGPSCSQRYAVDHAWEQGQAVCILDRASASLKGDYYEVQWYERLVL